MAMNEDLSNKLRNYSREELLSGGFFCGTIDGFRYHVLKLEEQCQYCDNFIQKYTEEQDKINNPKESLTNWRKANPELAKKFIVPKGTPEHESKKIRMNEYRQAHPEKFAQHARTRRAKKRNVKSEPYTLEDILARHGRGCYICEEEIDYEAPRQNGKPGWYRGIQLDHVVPISLGGANTVENVKPTHGYCNMSKGDKALEEMGSLETRKSQYLKVVKYDKIRV